VTLVTVVSSSVVRPAPVTVWKVTVMPFPSVTATLPPAGVKPVGVVVTVGD
jgi:hypothetical protein